MSSELDLFVGLSSAVTNIVANKLDFKGRIQGAVHNLLAEGVATAGTVDITPALSSASASLKSHLETPEGKAMIQTITDRIADSVFEVMETERGRANVARLIDQISSSFTKEFTAYLTAEGSGIWLQHHIIGRSLIQGITYAKILGDASALAVMTAFIFGDILKIPVAVVGLISALIHRLFTSVASKQPSSLNVQAPSSEDESLEETLTAIWQAVSGVVGYVGAAPTSLFDKFRVAVNQFDSKAKSGRSVLTFFGILCRTVHRMYVWVMDKVYGVKPMNRLLYQDKQILHTWALEVRELLDPKNDKYVVDNQDWFHRLASAYMVGSYFVAEATRTGIKDFPATLISSQKRVHELYVKAINLGIATSFRPEPVCVWVSGPPGVGKTYMKDDLIRMMLRACGTELTGNDIYTVNFTQKHWTGAENKKVIYYDDFGTVDAPEFLGEGIGQYMQLISDSRFAPPQAAIEDKGKPVTPVLVYCNANESVPKYLGVRHDDAFFRRRHICIEVIKSQKFVDRFGQDGNLETKGAMEWLKKNRTEDNPMPHILFYFFNPVSGQRDGSVMTFSEIQNELIIRFCDRYQESHAKFQKKLKEAVSMTTVTADTPLVEVLNEIERRVANLSGSPRTAREFFSEKYTSAVSWTKDGVQIARGWLKDLVSSPDLAAQASECYCNCLVYDRLKLGDNGKLYWNDCEHEEGEEFEYMCGAGDKCLLKSPQWIARCKRLISMDYHSNYVALNRLLRIIEGKPEPKPRMSVEVPAVVQAVEALTTATQATQTTPGASWPKWATLGCAFLAGAAVCVLSCKCISYLMKPESTPPIRESFKAEPRGVAYTSKIRDSMRPAQPLSNGVIARKSVVDAEIISSGDNTVTRTATRHGGVTRKIIRGQIVEVPEVHTQSLEAFTKVLDRSIAFLILDGVDRASQVPFEGFPMRVFGLFDHWLLLPKHYLGKINRTEKSRLSFANWNATCVTEDVTILEVREFPDSELAMVRMCNQVFKFKDVRKHIMTEKESTSLSTRGFAFEKILGVPTVIHPLALKIGKDRIYKDGDATFVLPTVIEYAWQAPGRCMTPIYSAFTANKIVGFHVVGGDVAVGGKGKPIGCAEPVVYESFLDFDPGMSIGDVMSVEGFDHNKIPTMTLDSNLAYIGAVGGKYAAHPAEKTSIIPTLVHGVTEPVTRPAPLKPEDVKMKFSPLRSGVEKHGRPPKPFDEALLNAAKDALRMQYLTACKPVRSSVGVMTVEEAVLGLPGIDGYQSMDLGTSEGFPWVASRPQGESNKRYLFDIDEERNSVVVDARVMERMNRNDKLRSKGTVVPTVFTDCLKDARIAIEKYEIPGKTRIFSISPVDYTIQFRQYFLDLLAAQKVNRLDLEHAVGINVHSIEWTQLARRVTETGTNMLCGDYTNFGPGLSSQVVAAVIDVWCDWYEHHETTAGVAHDEVKRRSLVRRCMMEELRHSIHLCRDILYQAPCGSPSGAPCTVNLNNDVNKLYVYMAWLKCFEDNPIMATIVSFRKHVRLYVYGDDLLAGVSDEVIGRFNNVFLQEFLAKHDIKYTDETKSGEIKAFVPFSEASFLKAKWKQHATRPYVLTNAQDKRSVEDVANWCRKSADHVEASKEAVVASLMLAYGHGREYFEAHRQRLFLAWGDCPETSGLTLYTYEQMENMRYGWSDEVEPTAPLETLVAHELEWRERKRVEGSMAAGLLSLRMRCEDE